MILKFPDLNTLHLALVSGAIPPAMSQAGALAGFVMLAAAMFLTLGIDWSGGGKAAEPATN